jgi:hypothetical protein
MQSSILNPSTSCTIDCKSCKSLSSYNDVNPEHVQILFRSAQLNKLYRYYENLQKVSYPDLKNEFQKVKDIIYMIIFATMIITMI